MAKEHQRVVSLLTKQLRAVNAYPGIITPMAYLIKMGIASELTDTFEN